MRSFTCGSCKQLGIELQKTIELGPDDHSDEVTLQTARCRACGAGAIAVYEESRRGSGDAWHHDAWLATDAAIAELESTIASCPSPQNASCGCPTHAGLRNDKYRRYLMGEWFALV